MVNELDSGSSGPVSSPGRIHHAETLNSHHASIYKLGLANLKLRATL